MCISVSPGVPVSFSDTILYAAEARNTDNKIVHVLGYQNRVEGRVTQHEKASKGPEKRSLWDRVFGANSSEPATGNAMMLAIPAVPGTLTAKNVVPTDQCGWVLERYARAIRPQVDSLGISFSLASASARAPAVQVFDTGVYTVVLASDARDIPAALSQVPAARRPPLNPALFEAFSWWYPQWTFAFCCFQNDQMLRADPMVWWYEPLDPKHLFLPALDCHTGDVPNLHAGVAVDHAVAVGSSEARAGSGSRANLTGMPPHVSRYFTSEVIGREYDGVLANGDFQVAVDDVRRGVFRPSRVLPPVCSAPPRKR